MKKNMFLILLLFNTFVFFAKDREIFYKDLSYILKKNNVQKWGKELTEYQLVLATECVGSLYVEYKGEKKYYIALLKIENKFRNQGFGQLLLQLICNELQNSEASEIALTADPYEIKNTKGYCDEYYIRRKYLYEYYAKFGFVLQNDDGAMVQKIQSKL